MQERDFNFQENKVHYAVFDTHKHIKELQACGFDEKQAEVLVKSLLHSRDYDLERLATKEQVNLLQKDIKTLEESVKKDIKTLDESVKKDIKTLDESLRKDIKTLDESLRKDIKALEMQMVTYVGIMKWSATLLVTLVLGVVGILVKIW